MDYGTLRVTTPDGQVREYPLEVASVTVGRADGNGVVIDHVSVSRRHAQLQLSDQGLSVEDLGSANGSFVGSQRLAANALTPPRSPESAAGEHSFSVSVVSSDNGREVRVLGTCTVLPFDGFSSSLQHNGKEYKVVVENQGNSTMTYALSATSESGGVTTKLDRESVDLAPGASTTVALTVAPRGRLWWGAAQMRDFRVHVKPARGSNPEATADGQIVVRPPQWKLPMAALAVVALLGVGSFAYVQAPCRTVIGCASKAKVDLSRTAPALPPRAGSRPGSL
jgi:FHA domain